MDNLPVYDQLPKSHDSSISVSLPFKTLFGPDLTPKAQAISRQEPGRLFLVLRHFTARWRFGIISQQIRKLSQHFSEINLFRLFLILNIIFTIFDPSPSLRMPITHYLTLFQPII